MQAFKPYESYKDSKVEWLGKVPTHWDTWKVTHGFDLIGSGTTPKSDNPIYYDGDIPWVTTSELRESVIYDTSIKVTSEAIRTYSALKKYPINSVAIAMYGATIGRLGQLGIEATFNQACCVFATPKVFIVRFFYYWLWMRRPILISLSNGGGQPNLSQDDLKKLWIPIPTKAEQQKIADFLDYKAAQIDALIAKKEVLLLKLQEKRSALITQAVTKGINPNTQMKPSGIGWIGDVPSDWQVLSLRHTLIEPLSNGIFKKKDQWGSGTRVVDVFDIYVDGDIVDESSLQRLDCSDFEVKKYSALQGDFFFVRSSLKLDGIGKSALVTEPEEKMVFECHLVRGRPDQQKTDPKYFIYLLNSQYSRSTLVSLSNQVTMTTLDQEKFKGLKVPLPPKDEQVKISKYLDEKTNEIDKQLIKVTEVILKLTEYRTSLICNAVTGTIDVRDFKIENYQPN